MREVYRFGAPPDDGAGGDDDEHEGPAEGGVEEVEPAGEVDLAPGVEGLGGEEEEGGDPGGPGVEDAGALQDGEHHGEQHHGVVHLAEGGQEEHSGHEQSGGGRGPQEGVGVAPAEEDDDADGDDGGEEQPQGVLEQRRHAEVDGGTGEGGVGVVADLGEVGDEPGEIVGGPGDERPGHQVGHHGDGQAAGDGPPVEFDGGEEQQRCELGLDEDSQADHHARRPAAPAQQQPQVADEGEQQQAVDVGEDERVAYGLGEEGQGDGRRPHHPAQGVTEHLRQQPEGGDDGQRVGDDEGGARGVVVRQPPEGAE